MKLIVALSLLLLCCVLIISCENESELEFKRYYTSGGLIYQVKCQNCHGKNGEGLSALIPPLTDSVYVKSNKGKLACIVKYGQNGPMMIAHKGYENNMPATGAASVHIAEVLTYITNSFGNKLGVVTTQMVNDELVKCQ